MIPVKGLYLSDCSKVVGTSWRVHKHKVSDTFGSTFSSSFFVKPAGLSNIRGVVECTNFDDEFCGSFFLQLNFNHFTESRAHNSWSHFDFV